MIDMIKINIRIARIVDIINCHHLLSDTEKEELSRFLFRLSSFISCFNNATETLSHLRYYQSTTNNNEEH